MNKRTVFKYEIKRLLFSKEYLLLLFVTSIYCVSLLRSMVLYGVNYTAPFSRLTFFTYCASLAPFLFILLLVLCARQFKASERGAEAIIKATPMPLHVFRLLRYGSISLAFLIATALPVIACFVFYRLVFDYTVVGPLLGLGVLFLLPPAILLFGVAMLLGSRRTEAIYILLAAVLVVSLFQILLPSVFDIIGNVATQKLNTGAYDYAVTPAFIRGRVFLALIGIVLIVFSTLQSKKLLRLFCWQFISHIEKSSAKRKQSKK